MMLASAFVCPACGMGCSVAPLTEAAPALRGTVAAAVALRRHQFCCPGCDTQLEATPLGKGKGVAHDMKGKTPLHKGTKGKGLADDMKGTTPLGHGTKGKGSTARDPDPFQMPSEQGTKGKGRPARHPVRMTSSRDKHNY
eukprot:TRINITY_DN35523_c0_g1_i1.p2 TRINITY_DN35523_c0_g1~~TRINITY_DN35523_c0_g1_i1.p2  ORF type:complete len:140 (+),score=21.27 TRINITY_DN35523_c0_g1_i1:39-458(+)